MSRVYSQENIILHNESFESGILTIADASVDVICIDPPYKYLKNQKLEVDFDEPILFNNSKRILKDGGFVIMFGRGESFYRWNMMLLDLGFKFKEEIIWDKTQNTSPVTPINRVHETIAIFSKGNGSIKTAYVPYIQIKTNPDEIVNDIKRIKTVINNAYEFEDLIHYLKHDVVRYKDTDRTLGNNTTVQTQMPQQSRVVKVMQAIKRGMKEKSIISENRDHFDTIHPTQKPVTLICRLLKLVSSPGCKVVDFFSGSGSTAKACMKLNIQFEGWEIDKEYFDKSVISIRNTPMSLF